MALALLYFRYRPGLVYRHRKHFRARSRNVFDNHHRLSNWRNQHTAIHFGGLDHFDSDVRIFHCCCHINAESSPRLQSNGILHPFRDAISEFGRIVHIHGE